MLNDLLFNNKEPQQAGIENPLNTLAVNDFLKPAAGFDNMFKGKQHLFKKKLAQVATQMNTKVFSNL